MSLDMQWLLSQPDTEEASAEEMLSYLEKKVRAREQASLLTRMDLQNNPAPLQTHQRTRE